MSTYIVRLARHGKCHLVYEINDQGISAVFAGTEQACQWRRSYLQNAQTSRVRARSRKLAHAA